MKTINATYRKAQLSAVLLQLVEDSRWFEVDPLPFDAYMVTAKNEHPLPVPLGLDAFGNEVQFPVWLASVRLDVGEHSVSKDDERVYHDYFARGLNPTEAIKQFKLDDLED